MYLLMEQCPCGPIPLKKKDFNKAWRPPENEHDSDVIILQKSSISFKYEKKTRERLSPASLLREVVTLELRSHLNICIPI
jgi:hypothetical protein